MLSAYPESLTKTSSLQIDKNKVYVTYIADLARGLAWTVQGRTVPPVPDRSGPIGEGMCLRVWDFSPEL